MNLHLFPSLERLQKAFQAFPGVGPKSALRMALHLLQAPETEAQNLLESAQQARRLLGFCKQCHAFSESSDVCKICADSGRNPRQICVVEDPFAVLTLEQKFKFHWVYHVTHGLISPLEDVYPEDLKLDRLFGRVGEIEELILAFSSSVEGEATATYLKEEISKHAPHVKLTRIAHGIPFGTRLDSVDQMTLEQALKFRQPMV